MSQRNRTIPRRDCRVLLWVRLFTKNIGLDPVAYGFTSSDAVLLQNLCDELSEKYIIARSPDTRTSPSIAVKNECMKRTLDVCRSYVRRVNANPAITDVQKESLGIVISHRRSSPIPVPGSSPKVFVSHHGVGAHEIVFLDRDSSSMCKPYGVTHCVLMRAVGDQPINDLREAHYLGCYSHGPIRVRYDRTENGKVATYFAAWVTGTGQQSKWTVSQPLHIASADSGPSFASLGHTRKNEVMPQLAA